MFLSKKGSGSYYIKRKITTMLSVLVNDNEFMNKVFIFLCVNIIDEFMNNFLCVDIDGGFNFLVVFQ